MRFLVSEVLLYTFEAISGSRWVSELTTFDPKYGRSKPEGLTPIKVDPNLKKLHFEVDWP